MDQISNTHTESVLMWVYIKKQFDLNLIWYPFLNIHIAY